MKDAKKSDGSAVGGKLHSSERHKPLCEIQEVENERLDASADRRRRCRRRRENREGNPQIGHGPSDTKFAEEMTKARKTLKDRGAW